MFAAIREIYNIPRDENRKLRDYPYTRARNPILCMRSVQILALTACHPSSRQLRMRSLKTACYSSHGSLQPC